MKQFITFVRKEFAHVLRDHKTLLVLFGMPVAQILIFGFALSGEIRNSPILILDEARDEASRQLVEKISASRYFRIAENLSRPVQVEDAFRQSRARIALVIPPDFGADLQHEEETTLQLLTDASDPNYASSLIHNAEAIIRDYQQQLGGGAILPYTIVPEVRMLYNPQLKKEPNLVPGVIALILMLVCVMMTSVSIVREKENGTMEVLLVSPFKPVLVVLSKAIPYLLLSLVNIASILLLSVFALHVTVQGSLVLFFAESTLFIVTCLTLGILISVKVRTQQVALLVSLLGMLLPTILFSGFLFPIANMPPILQWLSNIVPSKWYYIIIRTIMVKGLGFTAVWKETLILLGMTLFFLGVSLKTFKTRLA